MSSMMDALPARSTLRLLEGGFNLYAGSRILKRRLPYVDLWDAKGPGITIWK